MSESVSTIQETTIPSGLTMPAQFSDLQSVIGDMVASANRYGAKPTKVEATRLRKHLMNLAKMCKDSRQCVLQNVKAVPKMPRKGKKQPVDEQRQEEVMDEGKEEVMDEGKDEGKDELKAKVKKEKKPRKKNKE